MVKIGLEIHGYLKTSEKLFCSCPSIHGKKESKPNEQICPICTGQPGSKPMLPNKVAVEKVIQIGLLLGAKIENVVAWQRKHYNWPDLPKGYQNTISGPQSKENAREGLFEGIRIKEVHLEEDPAAWDPKTGAIDYNRSGCPLVEIVTEPDFKSSEEVAAWLKSLSSALTYIKAIDIKSGLKADVNISIPGGARVEVKNVNSIENIQNVIAYEIERQKKELPKNQETRMFDEKKGITKKMREKESAADYRFIIDPDLPALSISKKEIENIRKKLPMPPKEKIKELVKKYNIDKKNAEVLTKNLALVEYFEEVTKKVNPQFALPWITGELLRVANYQKISIEELEINPLHLQKLILLVEQNKITPLKGKEILNQFFPESFDPTQKVESSQKVSGDAEITKWCLEAMQEQKKAVEDFREGKKEALNFLLGAVMKKSEKRADSKKVLEILQEKLKS